MSLDRSNFSCARSFGEHALGANSAELECELTRSEFSSYLDGLMSGLEMAAMQSHLELCGECAAEFHAWRSVQSALGELGPAAVPERLQAQIQNALAIERDRGSHLSPAGRFHRAWGEWLGSAALRFAGATTVALVLLGSVAGFLAVPVSVQANDDAVHLTAPRYMYSEVPPQPIEVGRDVPVLVDAQIDVQGRVYDYSIVAGPTDPSVRLRVEENLLSSIFKPAMAFGTPVRGHVIVTYSGVSVRG